MYTASVRFGGYASEQEIAGNKTELTRILKQLNLKHSSQFEYLGYNAPFDVVNRRNEVQVELVDFKPELLSDK